MENKLDDTKFCDTRKMVARPPCPFYGFEAIYVISENCGSGYFMKDKGGSECALVKMFDPKNPLSCSMIGKKEGITWRACPYSMLKNKEIKEMLKKRQDEIRVFLRECKPKKGEEKSWKDISLRTWTKYITGTPL